MGMEWSCGRGCRPGCSMARRDMPDNWEGGQSDDGMNEAQRYDQ